MDSQKQDKAEPGISVLEDFTPNKLFRTIGEGFVFAFVTSEIVLLYLFTGGISRFPENVFVCLAILSAVLVFVDLYFSRNVVVLTSSASLVTMVIITNYIFGSSPNPYIFLVDINGYNVFTDFLIAAVGGLFWPAVLTIIYTFLTTRRVTKRQAGILLSAAIGTIVIVLTFIYSKPIMVFFDEHPWFPTTIIGIITMVAGIFIGRWQRKGKSLRNEEKKS